MGTQVNLSAIPNQSLSVVLGSSRYDITIMDMGNVMGVTILRDEVEIISMQRALPNVPILPYNYQEKNAGGNFMFVSDTSDYPYWTEFGTTAKLVFADDAEIQALIAALPDPRTLLGKTKNPLVRFPITANMELLGLGVTGQPQTVFKLKYKGAQVVSVTGTPSFYIRNADGSITPLVGNTNYLYPSTPGNFGSNIGDGWLTPGGVPTPVVTTGVADPFGGTTAVSISRASIDGSHGTELDFYRVFSPPLPAGTKCILSIYAKASVATTGVIRGSDGVQTPVSWPTSWTRRWAPVTVNAGSWNNYFSNIITGIASPNPIMSYCGAQLEVDSGTGIPGALIPTTTGPVTQPAPYGFDGGVTVTLSNPLPPGATLLWSGKGVINFAP